jgi:hypothetical protein
LVIPYVLEWDKLRDGYTKNLTRMTGTKFGYGLKPGPRDAIKLVADALTTEPSWVHNALQKAVEEYPEEEPRRRRAAEVAARFLAGSGPDLADDLRDWAIRAIKKVGAGMRELGYPSVTKYNPQERITEKDGYLHSTFFLRFEHPDINGALRPGIKFFWNEDRGEGSVGCSNLVWPRKDYERLSWDKMEGALLRAAGDVVTDMKRVLERDKTPEEAWSVVQLDAHGYALEVEVFPSKSKAEQEARGLEDCYVVKGTQMWNKSLGRVEEHDKTAPYTHVK